MKWETVKLGDIATCIQPGPFGSQLHNSDYSETGTPLIMPKDMINGHISHTNLIYVGDEHVSRLSRHQVHKGNIMVARKGDVRKCVFITEKEDGWMTGSDCLKVALNEEVCFPKFIYYQLRSPFIGKWLETISIGATMPSLNTGLLSGIEVFLPPITVQKTISDMTISSKTTRSKSSCWRRRRSGCIRNGSSTSVSPDMKQRPFMTAYLRGGRKPA